MQLLNTDCDCGIAEQFSIQFRNVIVRDKIVQSDIIVTFTDDTAHVPMPHSIRSDIIFSLIPPVSNSTHNGSDWYITYHILSQQSAQLNLHVGVCFLSHLFQSCLTMECSICILASSPVCGRGLPLVSGSSRKVKEAASMVTPNTSGGSPATPDYSTVQYSTVQ